MVKVIRQNGDSFGSSQRALSLVDDVSEEKKEASKAGQQISSIGSERENGL
jgi:hypothetical protein